MKTAIYILLSLSIFSLAGAVDVIQRGDKVSSESISADSLLTEADKIFQSREYPAALVQYEKALDQARNEFNRSVEVEALSQMARMNLLTDNKEEGRQYLAEAGQKASDSDPMAWSRYLGVKGRFEWKDNRLAVALESFEALYDYCHANGLWGRAIDAANMLAIVSETTEQQIEWSRKGIEAAEAADEDRWMGPLWNNLAATYYDMKQFDSALECYL